MTPRRKDFFREINNHKMRFFSLFALIAIGVFVLVGLTVTGPIMRDTVARTLEEGNSYDLKLTVSEGLEDEDLELIARLDGIRDKEYFHKTYLNAEGNRFAVASMPKRMSLPHITEGRAPEGVGEILLDEGARGRYRLGDRIRFDREEDPFDSDAKPVMRRYDFEVVGFARSPEFLDSEEMGRDATGEEIEGFAYVDPLDFRDPTITEAQFQFKDLEGLRVYDPAYVERNRRHREGFERVFRHRPEARLASTLETMRGDIRDGKEEIRSGYEELDDAKEAIRDGERELQDGAQKLDSARSRYRSGIASGEEQLRVARAKLAQARSSILFQEDKLSAGEAAWLEGKNAIAAAMEELKAGRTEALRGIETANRGLDAILEQERALRAAREKLERGASVLPDVPSLPYNKSEIAGFRSEIAAIDRRRDALLHDLKAAEAEVDEAERAYNAAESALRDEGVDGEATRREIAKLDAAIAAIEADSPSEVPPRETPEENAAPKTPDTEKERAELIERRDALKKKLNEPSYLKAVSERDEAKARLDDKQSILNKHRSALEGDEAKRKKRSAQLAEYEKALRARKAALAKQEKLSDDQMTELEARRAELRRKKRELEEKKALLLAKKDEALAGRAEGERALDAIREKEGELALAQAELATKGEQLADGRAMLLAAQGQLANGREELRAGERRLARERADGARALDRAEAELYRGREDLEEAKAEYAAEEPDALEELRDGERDLEKAQDLMTIVTRPTYAITPVNEEAATYTFIDYASRIDMLSMVFPVFLFAVALLLASTVMNRMVDEQRILIGTYKALGYKNGAIASKYVLFGTAAALLGGIPGGIAGNFLLSRVIAEAYFTGGAFGGIAVKAYPLYILGAIVLGMLATGFIAWVSVRRSLKQKTATLLLPKPPAKGTRIFLERITPLWRRLSFFQKVTARNLFRDKKRMAMTIVGVMGCVALLVLGFGIRTSVDGLVNKQFKEINRYDQIVRFEPVLNRDDHARYLDRLERDTRIQEAVAGHMESLTVPMDKGLDQPLSLVVPLEDGFSDMVTLRERKSGEPISLESGAVITEKLAELKGLRPGDKLLVETEEGEEIEVPVGAIAEGYAGHYLYMKPEDFKDTFGEAAEANMHYLKTGGEDLTDLKDYDSVLALVDTSSIVERVDNIAGHINFIVLVILAASSLLAVVVLSTLTNINIEEREREISTIRVLGFYPKEVTRYIYRETGVLTVIGILLGFFVGKALHRLVIRVVVPDFAMLDPALSVINYLLPAGITIVISLLLMLWFHNKLKTIDMVEALKGVE